MARLEALGAVAAGTAAPADVAAAVEAAAGAGLVRPPPLPPQRSAVRAESDAGAPGAWAPVSACSLTCMRASRVPPCVCVPCVLHAADASYAGDGVAFAAAGGSAFARVGGRRLDAMGDEELAALVGARTDGSGPLPGAAGAAEEGEMAVLVPGASGEAVVAGRGGRWQMPGANGGQPGVCVCVWGGGTVPYRALRRVQ